ncbi:glutamate 5-kinase [Treponema primitia ZAS-2]|uniref:Glutamate 5-kinase n=1 Tax=Treponema primitia (strain ATCC BAA-887 / DSM 12427 / ZAS-2) TaxID=545694 RepID=F5YMH1_TREPZ|nr:glutamate 5-kinase [Treponema primitia]AEF86258.1 glutamate 5-kinase [Treponema primitia ZAS-2]
MSIPQLIADARKVVFKLGSNTLADKEGRINPVFLDEFAGQAADLIKKGKQIAIVSSGAQVAGLSTMDKWARKRDIHYRQALCAVGQVELMGAWKRAFEKYNIHIAQILLTQDDFNDPIRTLNMRNTLFTLVDEGIIPIINENDTVSVEEIKIGDNDTLAAQSAVLWSADLLVLFSDIDGLYNKNPKEHPDAELIGEVRDIEAVKQSITIGSANSFGTGGIATKLEAAKRAASYGIPTVLAHGGGCRVLEALAAGTQQGTAFLV